MQRREENYSILPQPRTLPPFSQNAAVMFHLGLQLASGHLGWGEFHGASCEQRGPFQARKVPCRMADAGCGLRATCISVSKVSQVDFPWVTVKVNMRYIPWSAYLNFQWRGSEGRVTPSRSSQFHLLCYYNHALNSHRMQWLLNC